MTTLLRITISLILGAFASNVLADAKKQSNDLTTVKVTDSIYVLMGNGGNIGVHIGDDGTFLIDDQYKPMSEKVITAIKAVGGDIPKFIVNTH